MFQAGLLANLGQKQSRQVLHQIVVESCYVLVIQKKNQGGKSAADDESRREAVVAPRSKSRP